jgi:hypothetical protein
MRGTIRILVAVVALVVAGCGDDPANVAGDYTVAVTSGANGCNLTNWQEGSSTSGIGVTITQDGGNATAIIEGFVGQYVMAALGSRTFTGTVDGTDLDLDLIGTNALTTGNCTYTYNALLDGGIDGDVIIGTITYTAATNDQTDCAPLEGCESIQDFNGTRPPT